MVARPSASLVQSPLRVRPGPIASLTTGSGEAIIFARGEPILSPPLSLRHLVHFASQTEAPFTSLISLSPKV